MQDYFPHLMEAIQALPSDTALLRLERAANEHLHDARPVLLMAAEHAQSGNLDAAEACFIAALQRAPDFSIARFQLGLLQFSAGRPAAASATWAPLDFLNQDDPLRLFKTGLEYLAADKFDAALHWLQQGIARNTSNPPLNRDMQRFIDEIARVRHPDQPLPASEPVAPETVEKTNGEHFLVSAYRNLH